MKTIKLEVHDPKKLIFSLPETGIVSKVKDGHAYLSEAAENEFSPRPGFYKVSGRFVQLGACPAYDICAELQ